jgi:ABC-type antimicrobial peptide transport system permease subunit
VKINTRKMTEKTINQMAVNIIGHFDNREHIYVYNQKALDKILSRMYKVPTLEQTFEVTTPILTNMEAQALTEYMLNNVLTMVIFFVCLLTYILINSLTQTDVEERKYEFGVLRTLGLKNKNLVILISI